MKIDNVPGGGSLIDIKRFYPPFTVTDECPGCGATCEGCGPSEYLSYPSIGTRIDVFFFCRVCAVDGWSREIIISVTASAWGAG